METNYIWTVEIKYSTGSSFYTFKGTLDEVKSEVETLAIIHEKRVIAFSETFPSMIDSLTLEFNF